jgi:hypothetical protein
MPGQNVTIVTFIVSSKSTVGKPGKGSIVWIYTTISNTEYRLFISMLDCGYPVRHLSTIYNNRDMVTNRPL